MFRCVSIVTEETSTIFYFLDLCTLGSTFNLLVMPSIQGVDGIVPTVGRPHDTFRADSRWHILGLSGQLLLSLCDSSCSSSGLRCDSAQSDSKREGVGQGQRRLFLEWDGIKLQGLHTRNLLDTLPFRARTTARRTCSCLLLPLLYPRNPFFYRVPS